MIFAVFDVLLTTCRRLYKLQFFTFIFAVFVISLYGKISRMAYHNVGLLVVK